eukprot:CAMPEP_0118707668 /NCGR_PEP_ID=MMETSP0800-20121206/21354_1 /TAXON_ID=210618 ORGANISM="Striatella unipunctata, Strain CCMP2910" /NCGR_SAMPLE_ID=MMETSP0800 /ASSEMBLY_ACC=CAM_ASM_000638 /LENGTH=50 /DNA_ID=CAMNT_0006610565 /DNA_START=771 /DNA_END=923 /DNA_ORIENTATION=-
MVVEDRREQYKWSAFAPMINWNDDEALGEDDNIEGQRISLFRMTEAQNRE